MNTFKRKALSCAILGGLAAIATGCAGLGATGMSTAQLQAIAKDDAATSFCSRTTVTTVENITAYARTDKNVRQTTAITDKCGITMTYVPIEETPPSAR